MLTCRQRQAERLVSWLHSEQTPTIGHAAKSLGFSVRHTHSLAQDDKRIYIHEAVRVFDGWAEYRRVSDFVMELEQPEVAPSPEPGRRQDAAAEKGDHK